VITFNQLPASAQTLLKKHFAGKTPLVVTVDRDDYNVIYKSGEKVEFNKRGNWTEIECKRSSVPPQFVPAQIKANVKSQFPKTKIIKISRDRKGYEIELNNGLEIEYNKNFKVVEVD